ncbi:putative two-component system response regulator [Pseudonocardia sp. Ae168_Ps1]|uniref:LytR/AlgR family response regulator transcription factor n=1 Tax=unclassified Pseudonocardia TaxID=2619320 RepID=UPI0006CB668A|nr:MULTISPECIES: LytTR family DNA-binding domain-containing protein [unclassified Pseudonocardia]ALE74873.1 LytR family transcriptional regulator [Pseudonocardia sp. EC080625-04]ALL74208.1 LytR family transcriptional regulator [Pseudonocardia sp. EC080610-09]ALL81232.1 LytR family transcriptional regulator [Pseudonocardia sp. EC080619-01]OLL75850.1 putative two-component system response regulator [Pseudonocardia sp. Ae150A_Ps1]OLL81848.1 putative two-component system response regulator [Pseudo
MTETPLRVLAVDDVAPALDEICALLADAPDVGEVARAGDAVEALRTIPTGRFDAVFLDITMPGMDGLELGGVLAAMASPPEIVFVTAFEEHAVAAYGLGAVDYLLKPVGADRLAEALARVHRARAGRTVAGPPPAEDRTGVTGGGPAVPRVDELAVLPVELAGRTRYVRREDVRFVEAHGDYVRLHTPSGSHLVRIPLSRLEEHWDAHHFVRVHRSFLLHLPAVLELRSDAGGGLLAHTDAGDVPVSRRHARELRDQLLAAATSGALDVPGRERGRG